LMVMATGVFGEPRLLHSKGFIQLCLDKNGTDNTGSFLSTGTDGEVWFWTGDELNEAEYDPKNIRERTHCAVAWHVRRLFAYAQSCSYHISEAMIIIITFGWSMVNVDLEDFEDLTRVTTSTSAIQVPIFEQLSRKQQFPVLIGKLSRHRDHVLKLINLETEEMIRDELDGQVMCVSFDPSDEYVAVTSTDGTLSFYKIIVGKHEILKPVVVVRICSRIPDYA
uniref:WD_REPEATS_REGION domain-containing protein n=1 Tax=Gongylonema pulchrum TaxID=637853 RepID=A0A183E9N5_9BILA